MKNLTFLYFTYNINKQNKRRNLKMAKGNEDLMSLIKELGIDLTAQGNPDPATMSPAQQVQRLMDRQRGTLLALLAQNADIHAGAPKTVKTEKPKLGL
jgi:hypothetical protein